MKVSISSKPHRMSTVLGTPGPEGLPGANRMTDMIDVDPTSKVEGSILIYDETRAKWVAKTLLDAQSIDCGEY